MPGSGGGNSPRLPSAFFQQKIGSEIVFLIISTSCGHQDNDWYRNRKIKILHTPGHSKESISIIDHENEYVFTGDLIYNGLLLIDDCNAYINSINEIIENSTSKYRVFGAHGKPETGYERLLKIKDAIEYYRSDSCSVKPFRQIRFFGTTKNVYNIADVSFIDGYSDAFNND